MTGCPIHDGFIVMCGLAETPTRPEAGVPIFATISSSRRSVKRHNPHRPRTLHSIKPTNSSNLHKSVSMNRTRMTAYIFALIVTASTVTLSIRLNVVRQAKQAVLDDDRHVIQQAIHD
jgi:hypothetical protein